jgi:bifunctional DNA-binding transcriptional regulator/antitoxin component of YhaV-PrlF toxin-antitoxin module
MGTHVLTLGGNHTMEFELKRISVSAKRQITIPQKFFEKLGIGSEVECFIRGEELVIRPVQTNEFAEEILQDLIEQGFEGKKLLEEFRKARAKIRPAVVRMIEEADQIARNSKGSGDEKTREIFGDIMEE